VHRKERERDYIDAIYTHVCFIECWRGWLGGTKRFRIHPPPNIGAAGPGESRKKENKES
jgi:hypothetical protein